MNTNICTNIRMVRIWAKGLIMIAFAAESNQLAHTPYHRLRHSHVIIFVDMSSNEIDGYQ